MLLCFEAMGLRGHEARGLWGYGAMRLLGYQAIKLLCWYHVLTILTQLWDTFGTVFGHFVGHLLEPSLGAKKQIIFGRCAGHFLNNVVTNWGRLMDVSSTIVEHFGDNAATMIGKLWKHCATRLGPYWDGKFEKMLHHFQTMLENLRTTLAPCWDKFGTTRGQHRDFVWQWDHKEKRTPDVA